MSKLNYEIAQMLNYDDEDTCTDYSELYSMANEFYDNCIEIESEEENDFRKMGNLMTRKLLCTINENLSNDDCQLIWAHFQNKAIDIITLDMLQNISSIQEYGMIFEDKNGFISPLPVLFWLLNMIRLELNPSLTLWDRPTGDISMYFDSI
jgi:hypothetical protein